MSERRGRKWFKAIRTDPFVIPCYIFKANRKYVWPDTPVGSQTIRRLRISSESAYFKTEDEAWGHVRSQQGKHHDNQSGERPSRH